MSRSIQTRAAALGLLLVLVACSGETTDDASREMDSSAAVAPAEAGAAGGGVAGLQVAEDAPVDADQSGGAEAPALPPIDVRGTVSTGEQVIKEGTVTLQVEPGSFDRAFGQLVSRAQALGGHVAGSSSATDGEGLVSGQVTVRVPVRSFEDLLTSLGDAGTVVDRSVTSQDVSEEFTDLESRRRNLEAQERFYLGLLEQAQGVADAIAVQQQLEGIQQQIEQITGRLNLLDDRSSFSTLTIRIHEAGAEDLVASSSGDPSLAASLATARNVLISTLGALLVAATFLLPFVVLLLLGWAVLRAVRQRRVPADGAAMAGTAPASEAITADEHLADHLGATHTESSS